MARLLLGEGDFSFAAAVAEASVVATALDSRETVAAKYGAAFSAHEAKILAAGGRLVFGVDATDGASLLSRFGEARCRTVCFNFPHTGTRSLPANRRLLCGALEAAGEFLAKQHSCEYEMTLKTTGRYNAYAGPRGGTRASVSLLSLERLSCDLSRVCKVPTLSERSHSIDRVEWDREIV